MTADDGLETFLSQDWKALLVLFAELQGDAPDRTTWPALALREKARRGEVSEDAIPLLGLSLRDAEPVGATVHLAKTLAAFGREAALVSGFLIEKLRGFRVTDDESFWAFDGCMYSLGYIGDERAAEFLDELTELDPSPVLRSDSIFEGEMTAAERQRMFERTVRRVRAMLTDDSLDGWRAKSTKLEPVRLAEPGKRGFWAVMPQKGSVRKKRKKRR